MSASRPLIRVAIVQLKVSQILSENLEKIKSCVLEAKRKDADLIILPEYFNVCRPGKSTDEYKNSAENIPNGPTSKMLSQAAKNNSVYLVGGTFIEKDGDNLYNTCTVWNPNGEMIAKYRKIHLFDVDLPGRMTYKESSHLSPGKDLVTFSMNDTKIGLGICHDLRFEELAKIYRLLNCDILIYPSKFTLPTGELHFELLQRARAADNQLFVIGSSPARGNIGVLAWGYSQVTSPWGEILAQAGLEEEVLYCNLDLKLCDDVRQQIPLASQRRLI